MRVLTETQKREIYQDMHDKYYKDLYRYAYKLASNKDEAEDILQESLLRAWTGIESIKDMNSVKSWLLTIVKREFFRKIASQKRRKEDSLTDNDYLIPSTMDLDIKSELNEVLKVIMMLEEEYREVLILQTVYGFKTREISEQLGANENTISTRLFRGRKQLKELLSKKLKKNRVEQFEIEFNIY